MSMVANNDLSNNPDYIQPEIVSLVSSDFTGMLKSWWDKYLTNDIRDANQHAIQVDN